MGAAEAKRVGLGTVEPGTVEPAPWSRTSRSAPRTSPGPGEDATVAKLKQQYVAPAFASFSRPGLDGDQSTCAEDGSPYWHSWMQT